MVVSFLYLISNGALDWGPAKRVLPIGGEETMRTLASTVRRVRKPGAPGDDDGGRDAGGDQAA